jgi:hypothetical protein
MKIENCFMLLLGSVVSLAACTREQDSPVRSPETPSNTTPEGDNTASPNPDVDHGVDEAGPSSAPSGPGSTSSGSR